MQVVRYKPKELTGSSGARDGITLVEVMVSMAILVVALAGAYQLVSLSTRTTRMARNGYLAATVARSRVERAQAFEYDDLPLLAENEMLVNEYGMPDMYGDFRRSTIVNTNYDTFVTSFEVVVEIKNASSGSFEGLNESVFTLFTEELVPSG